MGRGRGQFPGEGVEMSTFEVTNELIIHCKIKTLVEAENAEAAVDAAFEHLPMNTRRDSAKGWKADVRLYPPKGVKIVSCKAIHFDTASGSGDKARKVKDPGK
jgi:hypothetical protein